MKWLPVFTLLFAPVSAMDEATQIKRAYDAAQAEHESDHYDKVWMYIGEGQNRQAIYFCVHAMPKVPYYRWPTTVYKILDAPEEP